RRGNDPLLVQFNGWQCEGFRTRSDNHVFSRNGFRLAVFFTDLDCIFINKRSYTLIGNHFIFLEEKRNTARCLLNYFIFSINHLLKIDREIIEFYSMSFKLMCSIMKMLT